MPGSQPKDVMPPPDWVVDHAKRHHMRYYAALDFDGFVLGHVTNCPIDQRYMQCTSSFIVRSCKRTHTPSPYPVTGMWQAFAAATYYSTETDLKYARP